MRAHLWRAWIGYALASAGILVASGCILLVHDDASGLGATCHFQSEETDCGVCIRTYCQPQLDACCPDKTCQSFLGVLDSCASNYLQPSCAGIPTGATGNVAGDNLKRCIGQCADFCTAAAGDSHSFCGATDSYSCACIPSDNPNFARCDQLGLPGALCCADMNWPGPGAIDGTFGCTCISFLCTGVDGNCSCKFGADPGGPMMAGKCTPGSRGATCCWDQKSVCSCGAGPCPSGMTPATTCAISTPSEPGLTCDTTAGQKQTSYCAWRGMAEPPPAPFN